MANLNIVDRSILGNNQEIVRQAQAKLQEKATASAKFTDQQKLEAYNKLDHKAKAALRLEYVSLQQDANMIGLDFFEKMELQPDEQFGFMLEDATPNIPVTVVSQFGGNATIALSANKAPTVFPMGLVSSAKVESQRFDLMQGFINNNNFINNKITYSINNQLDDMALTALAAMIGNLDSTVWVLDGKIKNTPTTNFLDLSATCKGKMTVDVYKVIADHFARIGRNVRIVYAPAARKIDLYEWSVYPDANVSTLNTVPASVKETIWATGSTGGSLMAPTTFTNMLDGETAGSKFVYAIADQAPGYFLQKPAFHLVDEKDEGAYHYTQAIVTAAFVGPAYRRMNVFKVQIG